jgi:hypothetical protein
MEIAMTALPLLTFDEAQRVGERVHDHWVRMTGEAPVPRDNFAWADLVQFVTRAACERLVEREAEYDGPSS